MLDPVFSRQLQKGFALLRSGQYDQADQIGQQVLQADPACTDAYLLRAGAARAQQRLQLAIDHLKQAITIRPDLAVLHLNLGEALLAMDRLDEAIAALTQALTLKPTMADAHVNLGNAQFRAGNAPAAIASHRHAIALNPRLPEAHYNLGRALQLAGQLDEAMAAYHQAIALRPSMAQAHYNLGTALQAAGRALDALTCYRTAVAARPGYLQAWNNLGLLLFRLERIDEARAAYEKAISLAPDYAVALSNYATLCSNVGQVEQALTLCSKAISLVPDSASFHSNLVFAMHSSPRFGPEDLHRELLEWDRRHARPLAAQIRPHTNSRDPDRKLRIGYVSSEFRDHVVGWNLLPLFRNRDQDHAEIHCYSNVLWPDHMTAELRACSAGWCDVGTMSDEAVADRIRHDGIDILVDLNLHTRAYWLMILARKPAPVQATFMGYPGSTGLSAIDYRLSDPYLDPEGMFDAFCSERTLRLPHSFWCYDPTGPYPEVSAIPAGPIRFACLNTLRKINDQVLELFGRVLLEVPDSRLMLLAPEGECRQRIAGILQRQGISPDRVEFVGRESRMPYLELYHRAHISLDPFPYGGHMTGLDSFWMGVPVITLVGSTIASRAGWSHLSNLGLTELAATTPDQYVQIARDLAADPSRLAQLRASLRNRMLQSPLTDAPGFARAVEAAYRTMWRQWCQSSGTGQAHP